MAKLRNKLIEKLASERRISHLSEDEEYNISKNTMERMTQYKLVLAKRAYSSHIIASNQILNS